MNYTSTPTYPGLHTIDQREQALLAPYAQHSRDSGGRKYPEREHPYRGPYQRDRDRILHSAAYRRLSHKTQVFTGDLGDYHRTRLTHTLEVASIARTIGRALRLNEDLIEALAMLHDIGHPPFGHAGEDALNECLTDEGGFSHNRYALCIVQELEVRYHQFPGLNLTREVLEGQETRAEKDTDKPRPLLEVQVVDVADSITYDSHDTDDAVEMGLVTLEELTESALVRESMDRVRRRSQSLNPDMQRKAVVHDLIDCQVSDVLRTSGGLLAASGFSSAQAARTSDIRITPGAELAEKKAELEDFLYQRVYRHDQLIRVRTEAQQQLREMFSGFLACPDLLPKKFLDRSEMTGRARSVGDYLAGMTDRYCRQQYSRLFAEPGRG